MKAADDKRIPVSVVEELLESLREALAIAKGELAPSREHLPGRPLDLPSIH